MILDRQSRINTNDLKTRLDAVGMDRGSFSPEELTEFVNLMQVYEGAMYEISTKLEILDSEFQVRFSHDPSITWNAVSSR